MTLTDDVEGLQCNLKNIIMHSASFRSYVCTGVYTCGPQRRKRLKHMNVMTNKMLASWTPLTLHVICFE